MKITGDVRDAVFRKKIIPHLRSEMAFPNPKLPDWHVLLTSKRMEFGLLAWAHLQKFCADIRKRN